MPCPDDRELPTTELGAGASTVQRGPTVADARTIVHALLCALDVEAEALRRHEPTWLATVSHGERLAATRRMLEVGGGVNVATYRLVHAIVDVGRAAGQSAPVISVTAIGTMTSTILPPTEATPRTIDRPISAVFSMRQFGAEDWRIVDLRVDDPP